MQRAAADAEDAAAVADSAMAAQQAIYTEQLAAAESALRHAHSDRKRLEAAARAARGLHEVTMASSLRDAAARHDAAMRAAEARTATARAKARQATEKGKALAVEAGEVSAVRLVPAAEVLRAWAAADPTYVPRSPRYSAVIREALGIRE